VMSATSIAAARQQRQRYQPADSGSQTALLPAASGTQDARLRTVLMGTRSLKDGIALQNGATFDLLSPRKTSMPLTGAVASEMFESHTAFYLPCEGSAEHNVIHKFVVRDTRVLNEELEDWALFREGKYSAARIAILARTGVPSQLKDLGKVVSNRGGYQSMANLWDVGPWDARACSQFVDDPGQPATRRFGQPAGQPPAPQEMVGRKHCRVLHRIASQALEQIRQAATDANRGAPSSVTPARARISPGSAWLNVNRGSDVNLLHVHDRERLSGTYYVTGGHPATVAVGAPPTEGASLDGCLVFRAGAMPCAAGGASHTTHSYLPVPPVPGELWIFPGSVPHAVLGSDGGAAAHAPPPRPVLLSDLLLARPTRDADGPTPSEQEAQRGLWRPRISIAMNFVEGVPYPDCTMAA